MSNGNPVNLLSHDELRPRLLSLPNTNQNQQQSRPPLENKHLNVNQDQSNPRPSLFTSQKLPRFSLSGINSNQPRLSTPVQLRVSVPYQPSPARHEEERANGGSSPSMMSSASPERAYKQSNRRISSPPNSRRVSLFQFSQARPTNNDIVQSTPVSRRTSEIETKQNMMVTNLSSAISEYQQIASENERLNLLCNQSAQELENCRTRLAVSTSELESANSEVRKLQPALATCKESVVAKDIELASVKSSLSEIKLELAGLKEEHVNVVEERNESRREKEALRKTLDVVKGKTATLINNYSTLGDAFKELKKAHDQSQRHLFDLSKEVQETRKLAKNGLAAVQPLLDDQNSLARAGETKAILKELQEDLASSHQVNDLLRDKLQVSGSQLIDVQGRIRELEEEKRGVLKELLAAREDEKRQFELLVAVEGNVAELSERLSTRERETIDVLANAAVLDADLKAAKAEIEIFKITQEVQVAELQVLRVVKEEHLSKLLALQDIINARDKEVIALRYEVKAVNESKAELRALLAESKKELAQKSTELEERNLNEELKAKIYDLEAKKETLMSSLNEVEQRHGALKKAAKDQEAAINAKVQSLEKSNAELASSNAILNKSLEKAQQGLTTALVASGKCQALEGEVAELKGRLNIQSVSLFQSKDESSILKERVNSLSTQLRVAQTALGKCEADSESWAKSQEKRASAAEASAAFLQSRLLDTDQALADMKTKVSELTSELSEMKDASVVFETENEAMVRVQKESEAAVRKFEKRVAELERENENLRKEVGGILERFECGRLTHTEKELVRRLMDNSQRIHEEDVVRKDNELCRRQHVVDALKAKVAELQGTIARIIKERDREPQVAAGATMASNNKPIVGLNAWMSSSSPGKEAEAATEDAEVREGSHHEEVPVAPVLKLTIPPKTRKAPPVNVPSADPRLSHIQTADSDDDDDKPLSELSRLSELDDEPQNQRLAGDGQGQGRRGGSGTVAVGNKRMRSSSPPREGPNLSFSKRRISTNPAAKPLNGPQGQAQATSSSAQAPNGIKKGAESAANLATTNAKSKLRKRR